MTKLEIFKNEDAYYDLLRTGKSVEYYVTTLNGYEYVMYGTKPFSFINGLGEKRSINSMDIAKVIHTRDVVTVILNLDSIASKSVTWDEIVNG